MNPENQNPGSYPNQTPGQQPPYNQPSPHVYGPQQYSPFPQGGNTPPQAPPKNNRKLILAVVILAVLLLITIGAAVFMNLSKGGTSSSDGFVRSYDSPVGLLSGMQSADIKSGTFKLRARYVGDSDFVREGSFVAKDGKLYFGMVTDDERVNELMRQLYDRQGKKEAFDAAKHGVTNYFSFDFASIAGYHYLYDKNGGEFSGFIPEIEAAKATARPGKRYTLTTTCDAAVEEVKKQTDMNTINLNFEIQELGINKRKAKISFATMQTIDMAVRGFFDSCYDLNHTSNTELKKFVDKLKEDITDSPEFTFWQEAGVQYLDVSAPPENTPFGGGLHFELTKLSSSPSENVETSGSYVERRNQFGLAYSLCRTDPVVTRTTKDGYRFLREDPAYTYPNAQDTGYYCTTLDVPPQFSPASPINLRSTTGASTPVTGQSLDGLRGLHDLTYEIEKYNADNKRYPGANEFRDMASSNMGSLTAVTQTGFTDKSLMYTALPIGCAGTCNDYVLSFVAAPNVQVRRNTYQP